MPAPVLRQATRSDVPALVGLLVEDELNTADDGGDLAPYLRAVDEARRRGCALVQLTSQKHRADAHRFYERLGFVRSHEGFKLTF